jgi:two-component system, OmpR family, response regulator ChvI
VNAKFTQLIAQSFGYVREFYERRALTETKRVLIVDDEQMITTPLKLGLERAGLAVTAFNDPLKALEGVKHERFDLIITDIRMPRMNGFELYREIRKHDPDSPICFLSAFEIEDTEFGRMFPNTKAHIFLKKPISMKDLIKRIDELTRR